MLKYAVENNILTVKLPSRIAADTIESFDKDFYAIPVAEEIKQVQLDASDLAYISSIGLRSLLTFKQDHPKLPMNIVEVTHEVSNIFRMTGFDVLFKTEEALRSIDIRNLQELGRGMYGAVYRLDEETVAKVFYGVNSRKETERILNNIRQAFVNNIPTIIPFDTVKTELGYGMVFELLSAKALADLIHENPEKIADYAADMAGLAKKLAQTPFETGTLGNRKDMLKEEIDSASYLFSDEQKQELCSYLEAVPDRNTAVHGDFHARNIYMVSGNPILIDMDDFCLGHPIWDIACLYRVYPFLIALDRDTRRDLFDLDDSVDYEAFYYQVMHVSFEEGTKLWNCFVQKYFEDYTEEEVKGFLETAAFYSDFMVIRFLIDSCKRVKDQPDRLSAKKALIGRILDRMRQQNLQQIIDNLNSWGAEWNG